MKQKDNGFTLLEAMIVVAILGIIAAFAVPAYQQVIERNRIKEATESLRADMQFARTQALKLSSDVVVSRTTGNNGAWCYGMDNDGSCVCAQTDTSQANYCSLKRVTGNQFTQTNLSFQSGNTVFTFRRGTAFIPGSPNVPCDDATEVCSTCFSTTNYKLKVVVNNVGKTEVCTGTANTVPGYETCATNCP